MTFRRRPDERGQANEKGRDERDVTESIKQKLQAELDELDTELRVHLPKQIKTAKEWGDLRENAEYHAALARQQMVQARIKQLRQRLSELASIDPSKVPHDKAAYGSTLLLYDGERDEEVTYRLVTPEESDPQNGLISTTSPVGRSLMGKEEGDEVTVRAPAGVRTFEIRRLTTLHDEASREAGKEAGKEVGKEG
jgi:transcription elongation factor GreA